MAAKAAKQSALEMFRERSGWDKSFGVGTLLVTPREINVPYKVIPTGSVTLDLATTIGGYPEGRIIQLDGNPDVGKRLALTTRIPTPTGWTTMGEIQVGDQVFDRHGAICHVTAVTEVELAPESRRIHFGNGVTLDADVDHQWLASSVSMRRYKKGFRVVTTAEMEHTLRAERDQRCNWAVPVTDPIQCPARSLPLDPYLLGIWLGNGSTDGSLLTLNRHDHVEIGGRLREGGWIVTYPPSADAPGCVGMTPLGLSVILREMGLLGFKHIPEPYLRASVEQRRELLRGLLDTDGSCGERGMVELSFTCKPLVNGAMELIRSLGLKLHEVNEGVATLEGRITGPLWRMTFQAPWNPFFVSRKATKWVPALTSRSRLRYIEAIERIDPIPMRCIAVDSPDCTYLAGEDMVVTHNTTLCFLAMASAQRIYPNRVVAYIDVEHKFDPAWAAAWGVDLTRLALFHPEVAEDAADSMLKFLREKLFAMIVVDSVGAMVTREETEKTADQATVAAVPRVITRLVKVAAALAKRHGAVLLIVNQYRANISAYGGETNLPGGWALKYGTTMNLSLRYAGKDKLEDTIKGDKITVGREIAIRVSRNKTGPEGKVAMVMLHTVESQFGPIGVDVAKETAIMAVKLGLILQNGGHYTIPATGEKIHGIDRVGDYFRENPKECTEMRQALIDLRADQVTTSDDADEEIEIIHTGEGEPALTKIATLADTIPSSEDLDVL